MPNTNKPTKDQANKIKHFINLALEYNKTHNLFVRTSLEDVYETDVKKAKKINISSKLGGLPSQTITTRP